MSRKAAQPYDEPLLDIVARVPGLDVALTTLDKLFAWGASNSLFIFPMATSCCGIELMAGAAARVDLDRMGAIMRGTPRHCDVMVVAGTITVKMAPRVKKLWDQMPEPKWVVAMGSCAISGDFYRDIYSVVPGIDTFLPVDVYIPGCPPNPEQLMNGLLYLQHKIRAQAAGTWVEPATRPETAKMIQPAIGRMQDAGRDPLLSNLQLQAALGLGLDGNEHRTADASSASGPQGDSLPRGCLVPAHVLRAAHPHPTAAAAPASDGAA
ncbi:MAG: NADH-quinone oxidoreductase subunit B [Myxococcales bacterium]|nr:NADH-quinone oxidoreductase subunit B [Myxococcales bacterium]